MTVTKTQDTADNSVTESRFTAGLAVTKTQDTADNSVTESRFTCGVAQ